MEQLIAMLNAIAQMSPPLEAHLRKILQIRIYKKGEIILAAGQICDRIFFIERGMVRSHYIVDGKEVSHWFMHEGAVCIGVLSFLRQIPSFEVHVAYEGCRCWGITRSQLENIYVVYPEFNVHGRILTGEYYCQAEERLVDIKLQSRDKKYEKLMEKYPELSLRVQQQHLATFLGVKKRTFDKMRSNYVARQSKPKQP